MEELLCSFACIYPALACLHARACCHSVYDSNGSVNCLLDTKLFEPQNEPVKMQMMDRIPRTRAVHDVRVSSVGNN